MVLFLISSILKGFSFWSLFFYRSIQKDRKILGASAKELDYLGCIILAMSAMLLVFLHKIPSWQALPESQINSEHFPLIWLLVSNVFYVFFALAGLFQFFRENVYFRIIQALFFLISIEWLIIFLTSLRHEYMPDAIPITVESLLVYPLSLLTFGLILFVFYKGKGLIGPSS